MTNPKNKDFLDPDNFYYSQTKPFLDYLKNNLEKESLNPSKIDNLSYDIFFNFGQLHQLITSIIKKEEGYTCSADKANHILMTILNKELSGPWMYKKIQNNDFSSPLNRNYNDWKDLIMSSLYHNSYDSIDTLFSNSLKIKERYNKILNNRSIFYNNVFSKILENQAISNDTNILKTRSSMEISIIIYIQNKSLNIDEIVGICKYVRKKYPVEYKKITNIVRNQITTSKSQS